MARNSWRLSRTCVAQGRPRSVRVDGVFPDCGLVPTTKPGSTLRVCQRSRSTGGGGGPLSGLAEGAELLGAAAQGAMVLAQPEAFAFRALCAGHGLEETP